MTMADTTTVLEREVLTIAAHTLHRENAELRRVVLDLQQELTIVKAEYERLLRTLTEQMRNENND